VRPPNAVRVAMLITMQNVSDQTSSSSGKRGRAAAIADVPANGPKRLRAHDLDGGARDPALDELLVGPENWVSLRRAVVASGWRARGQQASLTLDHTQTALEDISTCIHQAGAQAACYIRGQRL
jgi:hypothetical protein